jgi:hypothetical protein
MCNEKVPRDEMPQHQRACDGDGDRVDCACGANVRRSNLSNHMLSKRCEMFHHNYYMYLSRHSPLDVEPNNEQDERQNGADGGGGLDDSFSNVDDINIGVVDAPAPIEIIDDDDNDDDVEEEEENADDEVEDEDDNDDNQHRNQDDGAESGDSASATDVVVSHAAPMPRDARYSYRFVEDDVEGDDEQQYDHVPVVREACRRVPVTPAQWRAFDEPLNLEVAQFVARTKMKRNDVEAMLAMFGKAMPTLLPSAYHLKLHLQHAYRLVPQERVQIGNATVVVRQPLQVLASLLRDMAEEGIDLGAALAPLPRLPDTVPSSVRHSELYHNSIAYLNFTPNRALPLLFDVYCDEYRVDDKTQQSKQMALRLVLTADRSRMREVCIFPTNAVSVDAVFKQLIRPTVTALENGVLMHIGRDEPAFVIGSLHALLGDMLCRWQVLGLKSFTSVLSSAPSSQWFSHVVADTVPVRSLPNMVSAARSASRIYYADDGRRLEAGKSLGALHMRESFPLPELFHSTYKLLQSSIYRFGPCSMHQWTGLYEVVTDELCALLSWEQLDKINDILKQITWKTLNVPHKVFYKVVPKTKRARDVVHGGGMVFKAYQLTSQQWQDFILLLPDVLLSLDGGDARDAKVSKCVKLVLALLRYTDVIEEVRDSSVVRMANWRARARAAWIEFVNMWHAMRARPAARLRNGNTYVAMRPKFFDEALTADVVCITGPIHDLSTRRGEQQHQFGKFVAHHRSQRRGDVGLSVQSSRSVLEQVGGADEVRKRKTPLPTGMAPFTTKAIPYAQVPPWLRDVGVQRASASPGFHLLTHYLDLDEFVHVVRRDGVHVWGALISVVIVHQHRQPDGEQVFEASGSSWIVLVKEYDMVPEPRLPGCFTLTPCRAAAGENIMVMERSISSFEHVLTIRAGDRRALVKRAPPIRCTFD